MPNETYNLIDDKHCLHEGMTREQIINAIAEATGATPQNIDDGFISTVVETNHGTSIHIWKGTASEYAALETHDANTLYVITDDMSLEDIQAAIDNTNSTIGTLQTNVGTVQSDLSALDGRVTTAENDIDTAEGNITALDGRVTTAENDIDTAEGNIGTLQTDVSSLGGRMTAAETNITALKSDTGWQNITKDNTVIGKYRVIDRIAYFDIDYTLSTGAATVSITLPIELDGSGKANGIVFAYPVGSPNYYMYAAIGKLSTTNHVTTLTITSNDPSHASQNMYQIYGSFSYPVKQS